MNIRKVNTKNFILLDEIKDKKTAFLCLNVNTYEIYKISETLDKEEKSLVWFKINFNPLNIYIDDLQSISNSELYLIKNYLQCLLNRL